MDRLKILLFAANPFRDLNLDEEIRCIREAVGSAGQRGIMLVPFTATRPGDLIDAIDDERPQVVHFCGHGIRSRGDAQRDHDTNRSGDEQEAVRTGRDLIATPENQGAILVIGEDGRHRPLGPAGLVDLFEHHSEMVKIVVLNTCWTEKQAQAIAQHIACVIGTTREIRDEAARIFSKRLYRALARGEPVATALQKAKTDIKLHGFDDQAAIPQLWTKPGIDASRVYLVPPEPKPELKPEPRPERERQLELKPVQELEIEFAPQVELGQDENPAPSSVVIGMHGLDNSIAGILASTQEEQVEDERAKEDDNGVFASEKPRDPVDDFGNVFTKFINLLIHICTYFMKLFRDTKQRKLVQDTKQRAEEDREAEDDDQDYFEIEELRLARGGRRDRQRSGGLRPH